MLKSLTIFSVNTMCALLLFVAVLAAAQDALIRSSELGDVLITSAAGRSVIANGLDVVSSLNMVLNRVSELETTVAAQQSLISQLQQQNADLLANATVQQQAIAALQLNVTAMQSRWQTRT